MQSPSSDCQLWLFISCKALSPAPPSPAFLLLCSKCACHEGTREIFLKKSVPVSLTCEFLIYRPCNWLNWLMNWVLGMQLAPSPQSVVLILQIHRELHLPLPSDKRATQIFIADTSGRLAAYLFQGGSHLPTTGPTGEGSCLLSGAGTLENCSEEPQAACQRATEYHCFQS